MLNYKNTLWAITLWVALSTNPVIANTQNNTKNSVSQVVPPYKDEDFSKATKAEIFLDFDTLKEGAENLSNEFKKALQTGIVNYELLHKIDIRVIAIWPYIDRLPEEKTSDPEIYRDILKIYIDTFNIALPSSLQKLQSSTQWLTKQSSQIKHIKNALEGLQIYVDDTIINDLFPWEKDSISFKLQSYTKTFQEIYNSLPD